ncbi:MAG: uroporphyrinogen-III synthase [Hyphomicrobiales bacterium]|nr:uroporphyrinogen-III synthase [Hyphomicrobiales bacterium]
MRLLVTRPEPDNGRTAERLRQRGHEVLLAPMLHAEPLPFTLPPGSFAGVVLTSANAVRAVAGHPALAELVTLPAFVVGGRTAMAARAAGFTRIVSADGDQEALARAIAAHFAAQQLQHSLLYLAGEDLAGDLAAALQPAGISLRTIVVYRAAQAAAFPPAEAEALRAGMIDGVVHYSRRSAEAYLACARAGGLLPAALAPHHYCLSAAVAAPIVAAGGCCDVAGHPDEPALLALLPPSAAKRA